jgi:hypothetical protein
MSSKRRVRKNSCEGKVQYATLDDAKLAAIRWNKAKNDSCHPYKCEFGEHYHIGHPPKKVKAAIAARQQERRGWSWD